MGKFAIIPKEIIPRLLELSHAATVLYTYYQCRYNPKNPRRVPNGEALADLSLNERVFYRAKKDLLVKGWISVEDGKVVPQTTPPVPDKTVSKKGRLTKRSLTEQSVSTDKTVSKNEKSLTKQSENTDKTVSPSYIRNTDTERILNPDSTDTPVEPAAPVTEEKEEEKLPVKNLTLSQKVEEVFEYYKIVAEKGPRNKLTDDKKTRIKARLKTYSVDELKLALDGWKITPFYQGKNSDETVIDRIRVIFKNDEQVEKFIETAEAPPKTKKAAAGAESTDDRLPYIEPARVTYAELWDLQTNVFHPDADRDELYSKFKADFLAEYPDQVYIEEVARFEREHGFR